MNLNGVYSLFDLSSANVISLLLQNFLGFPVKMVFSCCVKGCRSESYPGCGVSFHGFPVKEDALQAWLKVIPVKGSTKYKKVCSNHFKTQDFVVQGARKRLTANAVPSVLVTMPVKTVKVISDIQVKPPNVMARQDVPATSIKTDMCYQPEPSTSSQEIISRKRPLSDLSSSLNIPQSNKKECVAHKFVQTLKGIENSQIKRKVKILKQKLKRRDLRIMSMKNLLSVVKKRTMHYDDIESIIKDNFSNIHSEFKAKNKSKVSPGIRYSKELKQFALTLNYYSPRAYRFLRTLINLPHPATIRKMLSSVECNVGFLMEVFEFLKLNVKTNHILAHVALIFDSMAIKSELVYDKNSDKTWGYVDLGGIENVDSYEMATESLIFQIVSYTGRFKCCIGYFLINKITANIQSQLVYTALKMLHDINVTVHSITCDGTVVNVRTFEQLGCVFDVPNVQTNFKHPDGVTEVHCIFDPPHMLKLARNTLGEFPLKSNLGVISFKYIKALNKLQESEGFRFANKLTNTHVNFWGKKMNVKLASQLISGSVADSIDFLRVSGNEDFRNSEATVEYIRYLDKAFDLMNGKNPLGTGLKAPLSLKNKIFWEPIFEELRNYLLNLTVEGQSIMKHRRKTFALGFYVNTISFSNLAKDLLSNSKNPMKYFLTYKCSQDHIEMFFSCIRARGGGNDNPNALQLKYTLRKLLFRNNVMPSVNSNAYDNDYELTPILEFRSSQRAIQLESLDQENESETLIALINNVSLSNYQNNILYYITGCIVKNLHSKITCEECKKIIKEKGKNVDHLYSIDINNHSAFTAFVNRGALFFPSQSVFQVVKFTERTCKQIDLNSMKQHYKHRIIQIVMQHFSDKISSMFPHSLSQGIDCEELHGIQLLKSIVISFLNMKIKHHQKSRTMKLQDSKNVTRQKLHKTILFSNL